MDRSLKARLIGASVLVLLVVLVVPELLSGRKAATGETPVAPTPDNPTRTYTIELGKPGSTPMTNPASQSARFPSETPPLTPEQPPGNTPAREPGASAAPLTQSAPVPSITAARERSDAEAATTGGESRAGSGGPNAEAPPVTGSTSTVKPSAGTWSVQVGAFGSSASARRLVEQLEADGFSAYVSSVERNGKKLHRVRVGPETARASADALADRLKTRGLPVSLVAND
jgi:DedD protein